MIKMIIHVLHSLIIYICLSGCADKISQQLRISIEVFENPFVNYTFKIKALILKGGEGKESRHQINNNSINIVSRDSVHSFQVPRPLFSIESITIEMDFSKADIVQKDGDSQYEIAVLPLEENYDDDIGSVFARELKLGINEKQSIKKNKEIILYFDPVKSTKFLYISNTFYSATIDPQWSFKKLGYDDNIFKEGQSLETEINPIQSLRLDIPIDDDIKIFFSPTKPAMMINHIFDQALSVTMLTHDGMPYTNGDIEDIKVLPEMTYNMISINKNSSIKHQQNETTIHSYTDFLKVIKSIDGATINYLSLIGHIEGQTFVANKLWAYLSTSLDQDKGKAPHDDNIDSVTKIDNRSNVDIETEPYAFPQSAKIIVGVIGGLSVITALIYTTKYYVISPLYNKGVLPGDNPRDYPAENSHLMTLKHGNTVEYREYTPANINLDNRTSLFYFHGNDEDAMSDLDYLQRLANETESSLFVMNYPGYGASKGKQTIENTTNMSFEFINKIRVDRNLKDIIPVGFSFGGAIATQMASKFNSPILYLKGTFSSAQSVTKKKLKDQLGRFSNIAAKLLVDNNTLNTKKTINQLPGRTHVFIEHNKQDSFVEFSEFEDLTKAIYDRPNEIQKYTFEYDDHALDHFIINDKNMKRGLTGAFTDRVKSLRK